MDTHPNPDDSGQAPRATPRTTDQDGSLRPRRRGWPAIAPRPLGLAAAVLLPLAFHLSAPQWLDAAELAALAAGSAIGWWFSRHTHRAPLARNPRATDVIAQDISTLQQAFSVLQQQVQATIHTSETAVMSMMDRMNRVYGNATGLRERILEAVSRSQRLSNDSLSQAGRHGEAVATLADHQRRFEAARQDNLERVRIVASQVRQLSPLAALIGDISRQTNLLAINASIEAARAGREGSGFKVVAAEVRRLSSQTADAARQITDGIAAAAAAIDREVTEMEAGQTDSAAAQLAEIAVHIQQMSTTLADVVPYMGELSANMELGMKEVTTDIIDTLGDMQFQDINRQLLEQINHALTSLSAHFSQLYELIDGQAPPPPILLEELLAMWTKNYVMHSQRVAHVRALGDHAADARQEQVAHTPTEPAATGLELATAHGPRVELF